MTLLYNSAQNMYFLLPDISDLEPGLDLLSDLDGTAFSLNAASLSQWSCTKEEAHLFLEKQWHESILHAKHTWNFLQKFSAQNGFHARMETKMAEFEPILNALGLAEIKSVFQQQNNEQPFTLEHLLEENTEALTATVFQKMPDIMPFFKGEGLEQATIDPEAWANALYEKAYGEADQMEALEQQALMKKDIQNTIASISKINKL